MKYDNRVSVRRINQSVPKMSIGGILTSTGTGALGGAPLGLPGIIAGGTIGLTSGIINHVGENNALADQELLAQENAKRFKGVNDANRFNQFSQFGYEQPMNLAGGGTVLPAGATRINKSKTSTKPSKSNNSDISTARYLAGLGLSIPETFNKSIEALVSPIFNPYDFTQQDYYKYIGNKFADIPVTPKEANVNIENPMKVVGDVAEAGLTIAAPAMGRVASKTIMPAANAIGKISSLRRGLAYGLNPVAGETNYSKAIYDKFKSVLPDEQTVPAFMEVVTGKPMKIKSKPITGTALSNNRINTPESGLAKGGAVMGSIPGISTDANQRVIAPGVIQLDSNKSGTDKINGNIDGQQVKLDDNELIIRMSDGTPVVISDDLNEVDKYKQALVNGGNINQLNDEFGRRAIARQTSNTHAQFGYVGDPNQIGAIANLGLAGLTTISNSIAMNKLNKNNVPNPNYIQPTLVDPNANATAFEQQRRGIRSGVANMNQNILQNSSSSNAALARLGQSSDVYNNAMGDVTSKQLGDVNNLRNINVDALNRANQLNTGISNQFGQQQYQDRLGKIDASSRLNLASIESAKGFVDNMLQGAKDREALTAIAAGYGIELDGNESIDSAKLKMRDRLIKLLTGQ